MVTTEVQVNLLWNDLRYQRHKLKILQVFDVLLNFGRYFMSIFSINPINLKIVKSGLSPGKNFKANKCEKTCYVNSLVLTNYLTRKIVKIMWLKKIVNMQKSFKNDQTNVLELLNKVCLYSMQFLDFGHNFDSWHVVHTVTASTYEQQARFSTSRSAQQNAWASAISKQASAIVKTYDNFCRANKSPCTSLSEFCSLFTLWDEEISRFVDLDGEIGRSQRRSTVSIWQKANHSSFRNEPK